MASEDIEVIEKIESLMFDDENLDEQGALWVIGCVWHRIIRGGVEDAEELEEDDMPEGDEQEESQGDNGIEDLEPAAPPTPPPPEPEPEVEPVQKLAPKKAPRMTMKKKSLRLRK